MTFVERRLTTSIALGEGSYGESGFDTVTLDGYRMTAAIEKNGIPAMNMAVLRVYGMDPSLMNRLSRVGVVPTAVRNNVVTVMAGDLGGTQSLAFAGVLMDAWADYGGAPEVSFNITASTGYLQNMKPVLPSSYPGPTDVVTIMQNLANVMGYTLENNFDGPSGIVLSSPYLPGTARAQAIAAAAAADIFLVLEDDDGIMAIFPKSGARATAIPLIQPPPYGEMVGYPSYIGPGLIQVKMLYNPGVRFMGNVRIQNSIVTPANGLWRVTKLTHSLSSQMPDGDWFTSIVANNQLASVA